MFWIFGIGVVTIAVAALDSQVPQTKFSCEGRTSGYYADVESGCQVYHMCDGLGRQFSYTCPNATLFQQRMLICDHWYMVNCSKSVDDYGANLRIGHREMPFVDDSESNPYHRTPRPDLLSHPSQSEYDIIYRTGKAFLGNNVNLVGIESDSKNSTTSTTDEPAYSLPSHWSTEYSQQQTTNKPNINDKPIIVNNKKNVENVIKGKPTKPFSTVTTTTESPPVNYKSYFKNTTPVFSKTVEVTTVPSNDLGLLPPLPYQILNKSVDVDISTTTEFKVNFKSEFKATTPVYPKKTVNVGISATTEFPVNFKSEFKATTPVYPKSVEVTSVEPSDLGILPPAIPNITDDKNTSTLSKIVIPFLSLEFEPPAVDPQPRNRSQDDIEVASPSKFYQPPKFIPDYTEITPEKESTDESKRGGLKSLNTNEWENLRKKFLIPDYEFPLESVSRPSYDSVLSSFQVNPAPSEKK